MSWSSLDLAGDADFPFVGFHARPDHYTKSVAFWESAFARAVGDDARTWSVWMRDPFKDGHPILSRINRQRRRGLLVQQVLKAPDRFWFKCWMSCAEGDEGELLPYLFVETFISQPAERYFDRLVEKWCREGADTDFMRRMTDAIRIEASQVYPTLDFGWPPQRD